MNPNDKKVTFGMDMHEHITGKEFGLFEYHEDPPEMREEKWRIIARLIDDGRIEGSEINSLFENNPFFYDWYKRTILADMPLSETYH